MHSSGKGTEYPSEASACRDEITGAGIIQLTSHPSVNHNLYHLHNSFTGDGQALVFTSYREGKPDLYKVGVEGGAIVRLTDAEGLHGFSGYVSSNTLFYTAAGTLRRLDLNTLEETVLAEFPRCTLVECGLNHDEKWIVTAFQRDDDYEIVIVGSEGGTWETVLRARKPIMHPQWPPGHSDWILYASDPYPRLWRVNVDGTQDTCLYRNEPTEWITHETFLGQTDQVIFTNWPHALRKIDPYTGEIETVADFKVWHICSSPDGCWIVCDTAHPDIGLRLIDPATGKHQALCYPQSSNAGTQWEKDYPAGALPEDSQQHSLTWETMKQSTDTLYGPQYTHPHPSFSPDGKRVVFSSDRTGHPQVYVVTIPDDFAVGE